MDKIRDGVRRELLKTVSKQIRANDPPATRLTFERLQHDGFPADEAKRFIASVLLAELTEVINTQQPFSLERYAGWLDQLPVLPWGNEEED